MAEIESYRHDPHTDTLTPAKQQHSGQQQQQQQQRSDQQQQQSNQLQQHIVQQQQLLQQTQNMPTTHPPTIVHPSVCHPPPPAVDPQRPPPDYPTGSTLLLPLQPVIDVEMLSARSTSDNVEMLSATRPDVRQTQSEPDFTAQTTQQPEPCQPSDVNVPLPHYLPSVQTIAPPGGMSTMPSFQTTVPAIGNLPSVQLPIQTTIVQVAPSMAHPLVLAQPMVQPVLATQPFKPIQPSQAIEQSQAFNPIHPVQPLQPVHPPPLQHIIPQLGRQSTNPDLTITTTSTASNSNKVPDAKKTISEDTKLLIKAALLQSGNRKKSGEFMRRLYCQEYR